MSVHIGAEKNQIADRILLPGDPLRAKFIAENFLENPECYNNVRGMLGYTGHYKGMRVSVQGTGMGLPSHSIYVHELINFYGVKKLIRVGSCGSLQKSVPIRALILAMSASTDSSLVANRFQGMNYAPTASSKLFLKAVDTAKKLELDIHAGNIFSSDVFYNEDPDSWKLWAKYNVLAVEMESAALYTLAARFGVDALCMLTVSDSLVTGEATTSEEREKTFTDMMKLSLETLLD